MNALKLVQVMQEGEVKEFEKYLDSPFSPGNGRLKAFFQTVKNRKVNCKNCKNRVWNVFWPGHTWGQWDMRACIDMPVLAFV